MMTEVTLANGLRRLNGSRAKSALRILVTDAVRLADPRIMIHRLPAGSMVLLRHYDDPRRADLAVELVRQGRRRHVRVLVAGDGRLAAATQAAGVHLPEYLARHGILGPLLGWRRRKRWVLSVACHDRRALARARILGADVALLSPVFPTGSHPGQRHLGNLRFRQWCRSSGIGVVALGGVCAARIGRLRGSGAAGIAGISAVFP